MKVGFQGHRGIATLDGWLFTGRMVEDMDLPSGPVRRFSSVWGGLLSQVTPWDSNALAGRIMATLLGETATVAIRRAAETALL